MSARSTRNFRPRSFLPTASDPRTGGSRAGFSRARARLWGRAMVEHTPEYQPLAGVPDPHPELWNIALAHGFYTEDAENMRSSPITPEEIERMFSRRRYRTHVPARYSIVPDAGRDPPQAAGIPAYARPSRDPTAALRDGNSSTRPSGSRIRCRLGGKTEGEVSRRSSAHRGHHDCRESSPPASSRER